MGNPSTDESAESGDKGAGDRDGVIAAGETKLIAVGIAFGGTDVVDIHQERTVALEDVVVGKSRFQRRQRRTEFGFHRFAFIPVTHTDVVLPRFDVQQVVDRQGEAGSPQVLVVQRDDDARLLVGGLPYQLFQSAVQHPVVVDQRKNARDDHPDKESPVKEDPEQPSRQRDMEKEGGIDRHGDCHGQFNADTVQNLMSVGHRDFPVRQRLEEKD